MSTPSLTTTSVPLVIPMLVGMANDCNVLVVCCEKHPSTPPTCYYAQDNYSSLSLSPFLPSQFSPETRVATVRCFQRISTGKLVAQHMTFYCNLSWPIALQSVPVVVHRMPSSNAEWSKRPGLPDFFQTAAYLNSTIHVANSMYLMTFIRRQMSCL